MFERLFALIKKEFLAIKNDKKSLMVVVLPPIVQVILFSFAATLEVKNINLALLNQDDSYKSKELIKDLGSSSYIKSLNIVKSYEDGKYEIDKAGRSFPSKISIELSGDTSICSKVPNSFSLAIDNEVKSIATTIEIEANNDGTIHQKFSKFGL